MDILVLDDHFQPIGLLSAFTSLIWNRKYYETGNFELHTTAEFFELLRQGAYLYRNDSLETGIIEEFNYVQDQQGKESVTVSGRFLKALLADRVIDKTQNLSGTGEQIIRSLVNTFAVNPSISARKISGLSLGPASGVGTMTELQATGVNLLDKIHEIGLSQQITCNITYDYLKDQLVFTVWQGKDRTEAQGVHSWATFSTDYANILSANYTDSEMEYRNYAFVAGEGENDSRIIEEVDQTKGEPRKELYVDARDLRRKQEDGSTLSLSAYKNMLRQRGLEKLAEYKRQTVLDGAIDANTNLIYKKDFDLGDICTFVNNLLGIVVEQRITEITEVYEGTTPEISVTFGDQQFNVMQKVRREVR